MFCCNPVFSGSKNWVINKSQTIVTLLSVNDSGFFDAEIYVSQDGEVLLPFKYIADILEIKYSQNHVTKQIDFALSSGKKVILEPKNNKIFIGDSLISSNNSIKYLKKGLMNETVDEVFIPQEIAEKVFETNIKVDKNDLSVFLNTDKKLSVLESDETKQDDGSDNKILKAYTQVVTPEKKKKVTFDTFEFSNSTRSDTVKEVYILKQNNDFIFDNSSMLALRGKAFNGDYKIDFSTYANNRQAFSFGGVGFNYKNSYKGYDWEVGKVSGWDNNIGNDLLGFQVGNFSNKVSSYRDISGNVSPDSTVNVLVNDQPFASLSTYAGGYNLKDLPPYKGKINKIKIEEQKPDGQKKAVFEKEFPLYEGFLLKGEKQYGFISGVSGLNNKLWSQNGYIYEANAKKLLAGVRYKYGINDKLTSDSMFLKDRIVSKNQNSLWGTQFLNNNSYLNFGTYRNVNTISGQTFLNSINYMINDNMNLTASVGFSNSSDTSGSGKDMSGLGSDICFTYRKPAFTLKAGVFDYQPDYYIAGSDSYSYADRKGGFVSGNFKIKDLNLNTKLSRYNSNLNNRLGNGVITFNEVSFGANAPITKTSGFNFNINAKNGENRLGKLSMINYNFNFDKKLAKSLNFNAGRQASIYESKYFAEDKSNENYLSGLNTSYARLTYMMPKNLGDLELSNDVVNMKSGMLNNKYNVARVGYTFPQFKGFLSSINTGYRYQGSSKGLDFSATLGYRFKSGRVISINYQFNRNLGYLLDDMFVPTNLRHSININLNDTMAFVDGGLKSVGTEGNNNGYVKAAAFLDINKNGKRDENEPGIKNVAFKTNWQNESIYTGKKGESKIQSIPEGIYSLGIDNDKLPALLSLSPAGKENLLIKVEKNKKTCVEFALISSAGNIKGKVDISDNFGRKVNIKDLVVVVNDLTGKEIAYTTVEDDYSYLITGLSPGDYTIQVDKDYRELYNLSPRDNSGIIKVNIPPVYEKYFDVNNLNLKYTTECAGNV